MFLIMNIIMILENENVNELLNYINNNYSNNNNNQNNVKNNNTDNNISSTSMSSYEDSSSFESDDEYIEFNPYLFIALLPKYETISPLNTLTNILPSLRNINNNNKISLILDLDETLVK